MGKGGEKPPCGPLQSEAERRLLRAKYRQLSTKAAEEKEYLSNAANVELGQKLDELDKLHEEVEKPKEHAVDAEVFCQFTEMGLDMVLKRRATAQGRNPSDLVMALKARYCGASTAMPIAAAAADPSALQWGVMGRAVAPHFKAAHGFGCMLGPLDGRRKQRKASVRRARQEAAPVVNPDELRPSDIAGGGGGEKQETDRNMEAMWGALAVRGAVHFAALVLCHESFAQTVENMFTLSFLVRDRRVRLYADAELGLVVKALSKAELAAASTSVPQAPTQFVVGFTMADWRFMKGVVPGEACIMQHRATAAGAAAAAAAASPGRSGAEEGEAAHGGATDQGGKRRRQQ